ncbi:ABC transporter related protein [Halothece sp. PCC 7418]|uniref:metal ABC transporter ATP-binding protein n=1 Tax=Halothece sp. (strain PCC 7418) TaxID=65093 RepID=UPI0002A05A9D|nr:metal ABC transporter ATP-binding protein [Halothece sp. PCC 7418]AFZ45712.1 ABC transporter related protein [Halothece sp. PCC 7418]
MTSISFPRHPRERIQICNLEVQYRRVLALTDVSCQVSPGRVTGMIGPNGAGKSTLMKAMLGLVNPIRGTVYFRETPLKEQLETVAYLPQRSKIDWTYPATVWDVVMMGRVRKTGWFNRFSSVSKRLAVEALERVGMSEFRDRAIGQLSGGQQQRVFIARALAEEAHIFCFDEPFAGIDQKTEQIIFDLLHELAEAGKIVLVVHHDLGESILNFDDLILLNRELVAHGTRQQVLNRDNLQRAYGAQVAFFSQQAA